jgi:hypothetical protein
MKSYFRKPMRIIAFSVVLLCTVWSMSIAPKVAAQTPTTVAGVVVFATGEARIEGERARIQQTIFEGQTLLTGPNAYLYVKTVDSGYLILRPDTRAFIATYRVDSRIPGQSQVKVELQRGVLRTVTGEAAKAARQNFRLNTPVAAIGVRGTDFIVATDAAVSRISVMAGGVVASPFNSGCTPGGTGPCEGLSARELFAGQSGLMLQISRDLPEPQVVPKNGNAPEQRSPARRDEPAASSGRSDSIGLSDQATKELDARKTTDLIGVLPALPDRSSVIWGRWQAAIDQPANVSIASILAEHNDILAINAFYAVARSRIPDWKSPAEAGISMGLVSQDALLLDERSGSVFAARLENGRLDLDFSRSRFATSFDFVASQGSRKSFMSQGGVTADGRLEGDSQFGATANMAVTGALSNRGGGTAAYLFQGRVDDNRLGTGVTGWLRKP